MFDYFCFVRRGCIERGMVLEIVVKIFGEGKSW